MSLSSPRISSPTHRKTTFHADNTEHCVPVAPTPRQVPTPSATADGGAWQAPWHKRLGSAISKWSSTTSLLRHSSIGSTFQPTGTAVTACYYIVSTVGAPFMLGLPYAVAQLGWGPGLTVLVLAYLAMLYCASILARLHEYKGTRHSRYRELGQAVFGKKAGTYAILPYQLTVNTGMCVCYPIIAGQALRGICTTLAGPGCSVSLSVWIVIFSSVHLLLALLPDISALKGINALGAATTVTFSLLATIGAALQGREAGVSYALQGSSADRIFNAFASLGSITLLFGNTVLLETQGTLRGEPSAVPPMLRAVLASYTIILALLVAVVVSGYWAFGAAVQPLVLDSIAGPAWLLVAANLAVVVNSLAGYLVFAHSLFDYVDLKMMMAHWTGLEFEGGPQLILKRFSFRWVFVVATAALAAALPFFFDLMAFLGAIGYAPLCFVIPCLMWLRTQPELGRAEKALCWAIIAAFAFVGVAAATGAVRSLVIHSSSYHFFS